MRVKCIEPDEGEHLVAGQVYTVAKEYSFHYDLEGQVITWSKHRFVTVEDEPISEDCKCGIRRSECEYHR